MDYQGTIHGRRYKLIYNPQPNEPTSQVDQGRRFVNLKQDISKIGKHEVLPGNACSGEERVLGPWQAIVLAHQIGKPKYRAWEIALHERLRT